MKFERIRPTSALAPFVEWFWWVESDDTTPQAQKIVPDGHPEIIFHFGDPYRIKQDRHWSLQGKALVGGQMRQYFYLENTGVARMFGITLKPTALTHLFGTPMNSLTGRVINLATLCEGTDSQVNALRECDSLAERIDSMVNYLKPVTNFNPSEHLVDRSIAIIRRENGLVSILSLCEELGITDRQLQRLFGRFIGLTPKYYARVVRFSTIFSMIKEGKPSWADVVHASGYYDQSHFIRDFKAFTGEDPSAFSFREPSLTNFFSRKSGLSNTKSRAST